MIVRHAYSPRVRVTVNSGKGRTKQSFKDETDINMILKRYNKTGVLTHVSQRPGSFLDLASMPDYRTALHNVHEAEALFNSLDAKVRAEFGNDAAAFLDFAVEPDNAPELVKLGLLPDPDPNPVRKAPRKRGDEFEPVVKDPETDPGGGAVAPPAAPIVA